MVDSLIIVCLQGLATETLFHFERRESLQICLRLVDFNIMMNVRNRRLANHNNVVLAF